MFMLVPSLQTESIASGEDIGTVRLWTLNDGDDNYLAVSPHVHHRVHQHYEDEDGSPARVHSVAFTPDGQTLASGGDEGNIFLWDTRMFL